MRVTQVAIRATAASDEEGRPTLTPELLAAVGARYSRSNEGLNAILAKIDPNNLDRSVDSIFRMIDYGHQSIADMTPVAIFIDEISVFLAYLIWGWCPTAGGQESSTRYIRMSREGLVDPSLFGVNPEQRAEWFEFAQQCFNNYERAVSFWEAVAVADPSQTRIPTSLLDDKSERATRQVARMRRNYAFDRARYFLPVAAKTNVMLIMSARGWVQLCQNLLSHWLPEAALLGTKVASELALAAPRMVKHATMKPSFQTGYSDELRSLSVAAKASESEWGEADCRADIDLFMPSDVSELELVEALRTHGNRYDFVGTSVCRTAVRFSWTAVALAEIRDLNRHRTGQKSCPLVPLGFYHAADQLPSPREFDSSLASFGLKSTQAARQLLTQRDSSFAAWFLLGTQLRFEHTTTLDKFVYEAELRTGTGAHFRYAKHLRDTVAVLGREYPRLASAISLGLNEPE